MARQVEITPHLLRILEDTLERAEYYAQDEKYLAHFYALLLLAQFREIRAYPLVVRFASLPSAILDTLSDYFTTTTLHKVLASVCGGDLSGIKSVIENQHADPWARGAALESLCVLVAAGSVTREVIVEYFASLYHQGLERRPSWVWDALVMCSCRLHPGELMKEITQAYEDGMAAKGHADLEDAQHDLEKGQLAMTEELAADPHMRLFEDTAAEMQDWDWLLDEDGRPKRRSSERAREITELAMQLNALRHNLSLTQTLPGRTSPKIGRNEACPCGSGKKYKKCCGA